MATLLVTNVLSGYTNGTVNIPDYDIELKAIAASFAKLVLLLENEIGVPARAIPGSTINVMQGQAKAINNIATMTASIMTTQSELAANMNKISVSLNNISAHAATSVVTQQVLLTETVKNNQYVQQTTEDALERSGLPKTTVAPTRLQDSITTVVGDVTKMNNAVQAASLVQSGLASAAGFTTSIVTSVVAESYVGQTAAAGWTQVKGWLGIVKPDEQAKKAIAEASNKAAAAQIGGA